MCDCVCYCVGGVSIAALVVFVATAVDGVISIWGTLVGSFHGCGQHACVSLLKLSGADSIFDLGGSQQPVPSTCLWRKR